MKNIKEIIIESIILKIALGKFDISNEKVLQQEIFNILEKDFKNIKKEYQLDNKNIIDFYLDKIGIEVKIKGTTKNIYRQLERYSLFNEIDSLILISTKAMGLPETINGKNIYYYNLSLNYL